MRTELQITRYPGRIDQAVEALCRHRPDLIIEGGTNNNPSLKSIITQKIAVPYVGLDVNSETIEEGKFTRFGNCAHKDDVLPIINEYSSQRAALVSWFALGSILSDRINHEDRKDLRDRLGEEKTAETITALYALQMHVLTLDLFNQTEYFYSLCQTAGWTLNSYEDGLIMFLTH